MKGRHRLTPGLRADWRNAAITAADSARGAALFESLACVQCHSLNGKGGHIGPDLGRLVDRNFTPAVLAATMWNHAPTMWASMTRAGIRAGGLDEQAAADLFAYFYSARFFEHPGTPPAASAPSPRAIAACATESIRPSGLEFRRSSNGIRSTPRLRLPQRCGTTFPAWKRPQPSAGSCFRASPRKT